ncbi:MAG: MATE family efflux transporter [Lachnospiraceae bacterium]|nr:MATE family efflux transporter [Lachnospiraceae bacterium]
MKIATQDKKLTEGPIWKQLLLFALPLLGSSFIQQLYNTVDLLFAGNLIGTDATAAVGASSLVITCLVGFFTGLSVGTGVIIANRAGSGEWEDVNRTIHTAMGLSLLGGALLTVLGIALSRPVLMLMGTPTEIFDSAVSYVRVYFLSMIPLAIYNMNAGIIRSVGNSRIPLLIQSVGGVTNVLADFVSIYFLHMGVEGVAWATMLSQGIAAVLSVLFLMKKGEHYRLEWRKIRIEGNILNRILRMGVPAGLQSMVITLSNVFIQYKINAFGVDAIAAFSVYFKVELLIYLPIVAFGQAMTTFAGQNMGAGKISRIRKGVKVCIGMGITYAVVAAMLLLYLGEGIFALFDRDAAVIACGLRIIRITFPLYWVYVILEVLADAIRGTGRSLPPMGIILSTICGFRTVLLIIFTSLWDSIEAVAAVYPAAWLAASLCLAVYWKRSVPAGMPEGGNEND